MNKLAPGTHVLTGLGWDWHENGVVVTVSLDGYPQRVFVPLNRVWHEFNKELSAIGCPFEPAIGGVVTVSGFFSSIAKAVSSVAKPIAKAVSKAASTVAKTATNYAALAVKTTLTPLNVLGHAVGLGALTDGLTQLAVGPISAVDALAKGGRIDKVLVGHLKDQLKAVKTVAPYAQIVISAVPGIGTGLNAAIGAGLALAQGQNITEALKAGVRSALPGGPLAAAAFDVANAAMQGKPISAIALNALPISPAQKLVLTRGLQTAQQLARGEKVSTVLLDQALKSLPPDVQKAVQVGSAIGHGQWMQAAGAVAKTAGIAAPPGALAVAAKAQQTYARGLAAATAIKNGQNTAENIARVKAGIATRAAMSVVAQHAQAGVPAARALASVMMRVPRVGAPIGSTFTPRYHTSTAVGALFNFHPLRRHNPRAFHAYAR